MTNTLKVRRKKSILIFFHLSNEVISLCYVLSTTRLPTPALGVLWTVDTRCLRGGVWVKEVKSTVETKGG